jgi:hypothetical protein
MISNCLYCPVYEFCGTVISSVRLCRAVTEEVQTEVYLEQWLEEQSQVPEEDVLAFIEELEHYERIYEEAIWADYLMYEMLMRDL